MMQEDGKKMAVLAIDKNGCVGAAANHGDFQFARTSAGDPVIHLARAAKVGLGR